MATTSDSPAETDRFRFGENWAGYLTQLDADRLEAARQSLRSLLRLERLDGLTFLDAGSGSGLFSLAASQLGAGVTSFDLDPASVACAEQLREQSGTVEEQWPVRQGSLLDGEFLRELGEFDIVYCWGVAHHTGAMWEAIEGLLACVQPGGRLVLAIYNDQFYISRLWSGVKKIYQRLPGWLRPVYVAGIWLGTFLKRLTVTTLAAGLRLITLRNPCVPFGNWARESQGRGMHTWYDLVDWVGGWPFEVARPEAVFRFARDRGFTLEELTTVAGHGCNEFVFRRNPVPPESQGSSAGR